MTDRTSAHTFAQIFRLLAEDPTDEHKRLAREIWKFSAECDFCGLDMRADDACLALGVARVGIDPDYPEDWQLLWIGNNGFKEASNMAELVESCPPPRWAARIILRDLEARRRALELQEEYGDPIDRLIELLDGIVGDTDEDREEWDALVDEPY